jgi:hypothetical protein
MILKRDGEFLNNFSALILMFVTMLDLIFLWIIY